MKKTFSLLLLGAILMCTDNAWAQTFFNGFYDDAPVKATIFNIKQPDQVRISLSMAGGQLAGRGYRYDGSSSNSGYNTFVFQMEAEGGWISIVLLDVSFSLGQPHHTTLLGSIGRVGDLENRRQLMLVRYDEEKK